MDMHASVFGTAVQARHRLAGIEQARFVEGGLDAVKGHQLRRLVLHAHLVDFLDADAVLASDTEPPRATESSRISAPKFFGTDQFPGLRRRT
jgi:hypothetical protein